VVEAELEVLLVSVSVQVLKLVSEELVSVGVTTG
jgi:hypothetical protein